MTTGPAMQSHFSRLAGTYRDLRTTDPEPILYIKEKIGDSGGLVCADIGCGTGRYSKLLLDHLPIDRLVCADTNDDMLAEAEKYLAAHHPKKFYTLKSSAENIRVRPESLDCIFSFNAIHHFDIGGFFSSAASSLKPGGKLFIYTRLARQNGLNIWGKYFPKFLEKETRMPNYFPLRILIEETDGLEYETGHIFEYDRAASLGELLHRAHNHHYSTFSFYGEVELEWAIEGFRLNILENFPDPVRVEWQDYNFMFVCEKTA